MSLHQQQREKLLELHQAKAEVIFSVLKERLPDDNLFDIQPALVILLAPLAPVEYQSSLKRLLVNLLDSEIELGILSKQKESPNNSPVSKDTREFPEKPNLKLIKSKEITGDAS